METFRSEYSEDGLLSTSRFGGTTSRSNSSAASLSFSSGSVGTRSARSDFLSSYELKFQARKAEKEKKKKKEREAATSNQASSTEEKWRAEREADRAVRKREMETWIPKPAVLKRVEQDSRKRSRERMKRVLSWYPSAGSEVHPQFAAGSLADGGEHERVLTEQEQEADKAARRAMADALQRRVDDLRLKVAFVEHQALPDDSGGSSSRRFAMAETTNKTQKSALDWRWFAAGLSGSKSMSLLAAVREDADEQADEAEMEEFLLLHRRQRKQHYYATKIQATWRMYGRRRVYSRWGRRRLKARRAFFQVWALLHRCKVRARAAAKRRYFAAWRDEVRVALRLREVELKLFRDAEMQAELPRVVMNLVFTSTESWTPAQSLHKSVQHAATRPPLGGGFVNLAFAGVAHAPNANKRRVQLTRALYHDARRAVVKKIVQRTFLLWKRVHTENRRVALNAQLCIKRAARMAFGSRPVWAGEKLLLVFGLWARWAAFARCKRAGLPLPVFAQAIPQWDVWVFNHQERHVRQVKAAAKAPVARMRRFFSRLRRVLLTWRAEIAEDAAKKKLLRRALGGLCHYARVKAALRPRKQAVARQQQRWASRRAWRAWKGVHLRSFFKRELNVSKLEQSQWRNKVHRIVYVWMGAKRHVSRWRTFEAWRNLCRKRRLFVTLRFHCERVRQRHVLFGVLTAWKAFVWKQEDEFLEDRLRLSAWDAYEELAPYFPKLFYGSYSAAAAIFGGVELPPEDVEALGPRGRAPARLPYDSDGIRQFQSAVGQGSAADVRNTVLQAKHLINAIDEASGNTALHVAMQVEDPAHRLDVLGLLLSEGAATRHHANRHGLTPQQLAPSDDARRLLALGVYDFYAAKVLHQRLAAAAHGQEKEQKQKQASDGAGDQRLVWCMVTLMSSEWVRGERLAGDVKVREWHSVLKDELWLRQERIIFASSSAFSPAILRCRAFLNGMKKKLARRREQLLAPSPRAGRPLRQGSQHRVAPLPETRRTLSRAVHARGSLREQQHVGMLTRIVDATDAKQLVQVTQEEADRDARAQTLGDLEAYARFLLTPTLDGDRAERDLVHSFVGVLFSLGFAVDEVLAEAYRLEDACAALEDDVLRLHDALVRAQWRVPAASALSPDPPLLCCFANELEMELFFEKELLVLQLLATRARERSNENDAAAILEGGASDAGGPCIGESGGSADTHKALAKELAGLLTKLQRKMRKIEKKKRSVEERITDAVATYRSKLSAPARSVRAISEARMALEHARLRLAGVLLKHSDLQTEISSLEAMKAHLVGGEELASLPVRPCDAAAASVDSAGALERRRERLEVELLKCRQPFRTKELLALADGVAGDAADASALGCLEVRRLHKEAKAALRLLFVANLFRCCCCWLAENMLPATPSEDDAVSDSDADSAVATAAAGAPKALRSGLPPASSRRRSSVGSSRKLVDTLQRASETAEAAERDAALMLESYASSVDMLFEAERRELQALARQSQQELQRTVVEVVHARNPITGRPEAPPEHLVDVRQLLLQQHDDDTAGAAGGCENPRVSSRNRKKEELRKAIIEHQLRRVAVGNRHVDRTDARTGEASRPGGDDTIASRSLLPTIHGSTIEFGNFVSGAYAPEAEPPVAESPSSGAKLSHRGVELMWNRGARTAEGGSHASSSGGKALVDRVGSVEDDAAFSASFRVLSASRSQRPSSLRFGSAARAARASEDALPARSEVRGAGVRAKEPGESRVAGADTTMTIAPRSNVDVEIGDPTESVADQTGDLSRCVAAALEQEQLDVVDFCRVEKGTFDVLDDASDPSETLLDVVVDPDTVESIFSGSAGAPIEMGVEQASFSSSIEGGVSDDPDDDIPLVASPLGDPLSQMRAEATEREASSDSTLTAAKGRELPDERLSRPKQHGHDDAAGDAFAAGSRFLSFIRWEKKDATPATTLPHIFQDAPQRSLYSQEERDVRQAHKAVASGKRKTDAAAATTPTVQSTCLKVRRHRQAACDPSTLTLQGKTAVATGLRANAPSADEDTRALAANAHLAANDADDVDVDVVSAIPRVAVTVVRSAVATELVGDSASALATAASASIEGQTKAAAAGNDSESEQLQLEGRSLAGARCLTGAATAESPAAKSSLKQQLTSSRPRGGRSTASLARLHSGAALALLHLDGTAITLPAANTALTKSLSTSDATHKSEADAPGPLVQLSAQQKQRVWGEFTALPLSDGVQNAYAVLYPHLYAPTLSLSAATDHKDSEPIKNRDDAVPDAGGAIEQLRRSPLTMAPLRHDGVGAQQNLQLRAIGDHQRPQRSDRTAQLQDRKFWSAVEGFKAIGAPSSVLALDAKMTQARRREVAARIHAEFLHERSLARLAWLDMYPEELSAVTTRLPDAPRSLFDALQQTAQLRISTALSQLRRDGGGGE
ncbi:hypothetical protein PybrP1_006304 [[Pythium] brassicae (nom. inval.)]|nr:hypothetical protein PybrP1_006304 [[Pythium] brassicae (nom. inval.)]